MYPSLLFNNSALRMLRAWFCVLAHHVDSLDDGALLVCDDLKHLAGLSLVVAGIHINCVTFLYMEFSHDFC